MDTAPADDAPAGDDPDDEPADGPADEPFGEPLFTPVPETVPRIDVAWLLLARGFEPRVFAP